MTKCNLQTEKRSVNDIVHGLINLPKICWMIIDTPQFQRLKRIKQLGACNFVYPSANHDRKEHSIGVSYLAGVYLNKLIDNHSSDGFSLNITRNEVTMVQIAALCHDLGHGPFSHFFDGIYIPLMSSEGSKYKHEKASVEMFRYLLQENPNVEKELKLICTNDEDVIFIEEALSGIPHENSNGQSGSWPFRGRGADKAYLYEIVSNSRCGIDVDRLDYICRDSIYLRINTRCDIDRIMENSRVMPIVDVNGIVKHILTFRDKIANEITNVALSRENLHREAYQHKTKNCIELMLFDALFEVKNELVYQGSDGRMLHLNECVNDMCAFQQVDDSVFDRIKWISPSSSRERAMNILTDIDKRNLYEFIDECSIGEDEQLKISNVKYKTLLNGLEKGQFNSKCLADEILKECQSDVDYQLMTKSIIVSISDVHFGMKKKNPMSSCYMYKKEDSKNAIRGTFISTNYRSFQSFIIQVFSRERSENINQQLKLAFSRWRQQLGLINYYQEIEKESNGYYYNYCNGYHQPVEKMLNTLHFNGAAKNY